MDVERIIPNFVFDWSLQFKTAVLCLGAIFLLLASYIRPEVSFLVWAPVFLVGALTEWLIVATVYVEMGQMEDDIENTYREVKQVEEDIIETRKKVETARQRLQGLANETYDIQGSAGQFNSLEPGGNLHPEEADFHSHENAPEERLTELERRIEKLEQEEEYRF